jgi:hypothetical protein
MSVDFANGSKATPGDPWRGNPWRVAAFSCQPACGLIVRAQLMQRIARFQVPQI